MKTKLRARLRVCASCEWIFNYDELTANSCPKCQFAHYGARYVYGKRAYTYATTQKPWMDKKLSDYEYKLWKEVQDTNKIKPKKQLRLLTLSGMQFD